MKIPRLAVIALATGAYAAYVTYLISRVDYEPVQHTPATDEANAVTPSEPAAVEPPPAVRNELPLPTDRGLVSRSRSMSFQNCLTLIDRTAAELGVTPVEIASTSSVKMVKWFTVNGDVLITCSALDDKMVYTFSP